MTGTVQDLLAEFDNTPSGPEQRALIAEAVRLADETDDDDLGYQARLRLIASASDRGESDTMIAAFSWCLGKHDADPRRFPLVASVDDDLLWYYKWLAATLARNPDFDLERIHEVHADMARRYREAGVGLSGVLQARFRSAVLCGDLELAELLRAERDTHERDEYSHCEACVRSEDAWYLQLAGRADEALRAYDEIQDEDLSCGEEPEASESESLLPLLRAGRLDDARAAHLRSYRAVRYRPSMIFAVARHLIFCARTGNEARALTMLEEHLRGITINPFDVYAALDSVVAFAVVLDSVAATGHGATVVRGADDPALLEHVGPHDGPWTVAELGARFWARAGELAERFDRRNGNDFYARMVAGSRLLLDEHYDVPLGNRTFVPASAAGAAPVDAAGWLERAELAYLAGDMAAVEAAVVSGLAPGHGLRVGRGGGVLFEQLCSVGAAAARQNGRTVRAEELLAKRVAHFRATGRLDQAELEARLGLMLFVPQAADVPVLSDELAAARARHADEESIVDLLCALGHALLEPERAAESVPLLDEAVTRATVTDVPGALPVACLAAARAHYAVQDLPGAAALLDDLLAAPVGPLVRADALSYRAWIHGIAEEFAAGAARADEHLALQTRAGNRANIVAAARRTAELLCDGGRFDEAAARLQYAVGQADLAQLDDARHVRFELARAQYRGGQPELALENLDAVHRAAAAAGADADELGGLLYWRGNAARAAGDPSLAYASWRSAIELAEQADVPDVGALCSLALGRLLVEFEFEDDEAVEVLLAGLALAGRLDDPVLPAELLQVLGRARSAAQDPGWERDLGQALDIARDAGATWLAADITDDLARAMAAVDRTDDAVRLGLQAVDGYLAAGDPGAALVAESFAARLLAGRDRIAEALAVYRPMVERLEPGTDDHRVLASELADLLVTAGDRRAADRVRRSIR